MAYSVNWNSKIVTVPKADMTQISASPEIYELNLISFWAAIHDIQDSEGMPYLDIMRSNAPVVLSGVTYARSIEVINGYKIEFENGPYQVNLNGANSNLLDARVQNNVSLNASNSAGLVVVTSGSGLSLSEQAALARIDANAEFTKDVVEADEEYTPTVARKRRKGTATVLVEKNVSGGAVASPPITLTEL
jgi:hypothetical protein